MNRLLHLRNFTWFVSSQNTFGMIYYNYRIDFVSTLTIKDGTNMTLSCHYLLIIKKYDIIRMEGARENG